MKELQMELGLKESIIGYLSIRPYNEVNEYIKELKKVKDIINQELAQKVLDYLGSRPCIEVFNLVVGLMKLKEKVPDKSKE